MEDGKYFSFWDCNNNLVRFVEIFGEVEEKCWVFAMGDCLLEVRIRVDIGGRKVV